MKAEHCMKCSQCGLPIEVGQEQHDGKCRACHKPEPAPAPAPKRGRRPGPSPGGDMRKGAAD